MTQHISFFFVFALEQVKVLISLTHRTTPLYYLYPSFFFFLSFTSPLLFLKSIELSLNLQTSWQHIFVLHSKPQQFLAFFFSFCQVSLSLFFVFFFFLFFPLFLPPGASNFDFPFIFFLLPLLGKVFGHIESDILSVGRANWSKVPHRLLFMTKYEQRVLQGYSSVTRILFSSLMFSLLFALLLF